MSISLQYRQVGLILKRWCQEGITVIATVLDQSQFIGNYGEGLKDTDYILILSHKIDTSNFHTPMLCPLPPLPRPL